MVINGHKYGADTDSLNGGTGKTCLGGGMHCPSASSCLCVSLFVYLSVSMVTKKKLWVDFFS